MREPINSRSGYRLTATVVAASALLVVVACSASGPPPAEEILLPGAVSGVELDHLHLQGSDIVDSDDPNWQASLAELGVDAGDLHLAVASAPADSGLELRLVAMKVAGADWGSRLQAFIDRSGAVGAVSFDQVVLGGKTAFRARSTGDPALPTTYYYPSGEVLYTLVGNEAAVGEALSQLPGSSSSATSQGMASPSLSQAQATNFLLPVFVDTPVPPHPVGWESHRFRIVALNRDLIPDPYAWITASLQAGRLEPQSFTGGMDVIYLNDRWNQGTELIEIEAVSQATGDVGNGFLTFELRHWLDDLWVDGPRYLAVEHDFEQMPSQVTATISEGTLSCGETGTAFSGTLNGDSFGGDDMKVCNPEPCVEEGLLDKTALRPYEATVADDSWSVAFVWDRQLFDFEYDDEGNLVACPLTGVEKASFSISRMGEPL